MKSKSGSSLFELSPQNQPVPDSFKVMTNLLLLNGANKEVIAAMLEIAQFSIHHVRWLTRPVIVHQSLWMETLPKWLIEAIYLDRLERIFQEHETGEIGVLATPAEVLACMYPATMEAPLHSDWVNVYLWVGNEVFSKHQRLQETSLWQLLGEDRPVKFESIKSDFEQLAKDIRRKVVEAAKQRGWGKKPLPSTTASQKSPPDAENRPLQYTLF